jgi:hypothetical protein
MLNIGFIGKTEILEPHVKRLQKIKGLTIVGKTSVGTDAQLNSFHFSIPEINRVELIERADIIVMDNSSVLPFKMLCDIVKKSKHIFTIEYLNLSIDECSQLNSLANESGSVIQVTNPYFFTPAIQWLNNHLISPTFLDISYLTEEKITDSTLISLLLMLTGTTGISPKKIGAVTFRTKETESKFNNVRLEFGDASVVNINYGNLPPLNEFKIKSYSPGQFVTFNLSAKNFRCNNKPVDLSEYSSVSELDTFLKAVQHKSKQISNIEDYLIVLHAVQKIGKKITQFSTH